MFFGRFLRPRRSSHNRRELLRYLFPHTLRSRYRENLLLFHLNVLPRIKYQAQSKIHRLLLWRHRRRIENSRILDLVRRRTPPPGSLPREARRPRGAGHVAAGRKNMLSSTGGRATYGGGGYDSNNGVSTAGDRGSRRQRLAAMAGSMYRAGASAVTEIKESYAQTRTRAFDPSDDERPSIPDSFPHARITVHGGDQMVLFPTYAKRHVKKAPRSVHHEGMEDASNSQEAHWISEWEREATADAIVDVDVRGWIYTPQTGPLTRKNRVVMGLARQLSGIPRLVNNISSAVGNGEEHREQEKIDMEAAKIEMRGQEEGRAANRGEYSETPGRSASGSSSRTSSSLRPSSGNGPARPVSPNPSLSSQRQNTATTDLTDAELATANANLMARLAPFLTTPFAHLPITVFFYNESCSQSRTVTTSASGQFIVRAALPFVPTHVRVLATGDLSAIQPVNVTESEGVSLISDIDDTIKRSNISSGAREIFRNTFIRELPGLTVDGVREWYNLMHSMGVSMHYCSNSPWQLFPVLATFFKLSGIPPGSIHLKEYNGMLQGIFEPVAERKKPTLERILTDFPQRKFILVGDSGEADLEVYTELVLANPGRILAVFIRDVTTPEQPGFFDSSFDAGMRRAGDGVAADTKKASTPIDRGDRPASRPELPPRVLPDPPRSAEKLDNVPTGNLIDFSDDEPVPEAAPGPKLTKQTSTGSGSSTRARPPRPAKPAALRSTSVETNQSQSSLGETPGRAKSSSSAPLPPPPPRSQKPVRTLTDQTNRPSRQPLSKTESLSKQAPGAWAANLDQRGAPPLGNSNNTSKTPPPPPPPRRTGTQPLRDPPRGSTDSPAPPSRPSKTNFDDLLGPARPESPRTTTIHPSQSLPSNPQTNTEGSAQGPSAAAAVNKKLELWRRRLERAHDILDQQGVPLYTWRTGHDVIEEAVGIVRGALDGGREGARAGEKRNKPATDIRRDQY